MVRPLTGLSETEVLWELPLCRGMAYFHAAMVQSGTDTKWLGEEGEDESMKAVRTLLREKPWRN